MKHFFFLLLSLFLLFRSKEMEYRAFKASLKVHSKYKPGIHEDNFKTKVLTIEHLISVTINGKK